MSFVGSNILAGASGQGGAGYEIERSLRFNSADSAYLSRTPSSVGNRRTFTWSGWCKRSKPGNSTNQYLFATSNVAGDNYASLFFGTSDNLIFQGNNGSSSVQFNLISSAVFRDISAWYHIVLSVDSTQSTSSDRVKLYVNGQQLDSFGTATYPSQNFDFRINSTEAHGISYSPNFTAYFDGYLADVHFIDGQALDPTSFGEFDDNNVWQPKKFTGNYNTTAGTVYSNQTITNENSSYPTTGMFDGVYGSSASLSNATLAGGANAVYSVYTFANPISYSNSVRIYADFDTRSTPNPDIKANNTSITGVTDNVGLGSTNKKWYTVLSGSGTLSSISLNGIGAGYMAAIYAIEVDGSVLVDSTNTAGVNGFHLPFSDNSTIAALGTDTSGNGNDWTVNNFGITTVVGPSYSTTGSFNTPASQLFDNDTSTFATCQNGQSCAAIFSIPFTSSLRCYITTHADMDRFGGTVFRFTGGTTNVTPTFATYTGWYDFTSIGSPFTRIDWTRTTNSFGAFGVSAIEVDGQIVYISDNDSLVDTPTNYGNDTGAGGEVRGNYATLNPLDRQSSNGELSNGNLDIKQTPSAWAMYRSTMFVSSGKWYWEVTLGNDEYSTIGICTDVYQMASGSNNWASNSDEFVGFYPYDGKVYNASNTISYTNGDTSASGSVIGVALDMDNGTLTFYKDGTSLGQATSGLTGKNISPTHWLYDSTAADSYNFGQRPFTYTAPSGYKALCTTNLSDPTIADGSTAFDIVTWSGAGGSGDKTITGLNLSDAPDLVWSKTRNHAYHNILFDSVRGFGASNALITDYLGTSDAGRIKSTAASSITWEQSGSGRLWFDESSKTYVAWAWDAGNATTTITAGSLNSSIYASSRTWSSDLSATSLANQGKMFDWTYGYGSYTGTCTWTTTDAAYSNLSGRVYLANNTTLTLGITFKDSYGTTLGTFSLPWTGNGQEMQDTGFNWSSSVASVEITGDYLPVRVQIGNQTLVDTGTTVPNVPSIASTVRANPAAGFSIVSVTADADADGDTVGHGLNAKPEMIIEKNISAASPWYVHHSGLGDMSGSYLRLNGTNAKATDNTWNVSEPTSLVISADPGYLHANTNADVIYYCFAPVDGYSSFGSYTANGSADGPFVFTGMRPKFIMIKASSNAGDMTYASWLIVDSERDTYNVSDAGLFANKASIEGTRGVGSGTAGTWLDILSNGFKIRYNGTEVNGVSSQTYIYAAFAENPFKTARAR